MKLGMAGYIFLFSVVILYLLLPLKDSNHKKTLSPNMSRKCTILFFLFLIFWAILRGKITVDANIYLNRYNLIVNNREIMIEPAYRALNRIAHYIFHDYQGIIIITSIIYILSIYFAGRVLSENMQYAVAMFFLYDFFFYGINQIRQYTGIAFFLISLCCFQKKKYVLTLVFCLLASMTHTVCILLLAIYLLSRVQISKKLYIALILSSPFLVLFANRAFSYVFAHIGNGQFITYALGGGNFNYKAKLIQPLLKSWGLSFFYIMIWDNIKEIDKNNILINCSLIASILAMTGNISSEIVRVVNSFLLIQVFYIPAIVKYIRKNRPLYVIWGLYIMGLLVLLYIYSFRPLSERPYYISDFFIS